MIKSISIFLIVFGFHYLSSQAIENRNNYYPKVEHEEWFKLIPMLDSTTPDWARIMYEESENYEKVESLKKAYYKTHPFEKNIHTQNYKFWLRTIRNYIDENGVVDMPAPGTEFLNYEAGKKEKPKAVNKSVMNSWTNIGPNITYKSDGTLNTRPTQANVYCIGVAPSNTSIVYAGMETGGIFKSIDKGMNWAPVSYDYAIGNIADIKVDPLNPDIVYAARGSEMYKTTDGGVSWTQIYVAGGVVEQFYIHTTDTDTLYAATRIGLLKSTDGGSNWTNKFTGYIYDIEAKPGTNDTFYISTKNDVAKRPEIFKSTDAGENWTIIDNGFYSPSDLSVATVYGCKIGVTPADPNRLYAGIIATGKAGDNGWIGVYYSLDEGASWQEDSGFDGGPYESGNDPATNWYVAGYSSGYHQGWYNFDLDVSHTDPDKIWIGTIWFCESGNKGGNIEYIRGSRSLEMHADIQDIDVVGNDIWVVSDGGINYSDDECLTVEIRMLGISASDFWGFGQGWNEDIFVGGRYHNGDAVYHENYGLGNSIFLGGAESATGYVNQLDNRKTYFSDIGDKRIPSALNSTGSEIPNLGMYPTQSYFDFSYSEVEWDPRYGNHLYLGNTNTLFKSVDGGATFNNLYTFGGEVRRFEISRDDPDYIYIIVYFSTNDWRVFKSSDAGLSFTECTTPPYSGGTWRNLSIALNPFDKNEIWIASNSSSDGNKVFSSVDGGNSWTNRYTSTIAGEAIKDLIYHNNTEGNKIYALTNDNFYYYDMTEFNWYEYSLGLPIQHSGFKILPFYRDEKIRMAGAKGIWEIPFNGSNIVHPLPMASHDTVFCSRDTVLFDSYSIVNPKGASWAWTFAPAPLWVSDLSVRNPKVVFGSDGSYDVDLVITKGGQNYSKSINSMVTVASECTADTIAGMNLKTDANGESVVVSDANLQNITHFTVSGWWKPDGGQQGFAALWSSGDWCAHCDYTEGLIVDYFGSRVWYKWPGNAANWGSNSGMTIPLDEWSYVALVIEPTGATMYLNDQKYVHNIALNPGDIANYHIGFGHYDKSFYGNIDEVTLWNRALTESEIRRLRHITKEDEIVNDPDLIAYYQFNQLVGGTQVMDKAGTRHGIIHPNSELEVSTAPVGGGESDILDVLSGQYSYTFPNAEATIKLTTCEELAGDQIVLSRLDVGPNETANGNPFPKNHWIINYYGNNGTFNNIDTLQLSLSDTAFINSLITAQQVVLHERPENSDAGDWTSKSYGIGLANNTLIFDRKSLIDGRTQISLSDGANPFVENDPGNPCFIDTIPINAIDFNGSSTAYAKTADAADLDFGASQNFSVSCWIKTATLSSDAVIAAKKDWDSGFNPGWVISTKDGQLWVNIGDGIRRVDMQPAQLINDNEWHYIACTFDRTALANIYIDGQLVDSENISDVGNLDNALEMVIGADSEYDYPIDATIEEFCIYDKALSQEEIRELRHLTRKLNNPNVIAYYQFNFNPGEIFDKFGSHHLSLGNDADLITSDCPIGGGSVARHNIITDGTYSFSDTGLDITFPSGGSLPNGEIVVSRLNIHPDTLNNSSGIFSDYWIINNYGSNTTFNSVSELQLSDIDALDVFNDATSFNLFHRNENATGPVWNILDSGDVLDNMNSSITFNTGLSLTSFGQFTIDNANGFCWIGIQDNDWDNPDNWKNGSMPGIDSEVYIPAGAPFYPIVNVNAQIRTLYVANGASMWVPIGKIFEVIF